MYMESCSHFVAQVISLVRWPKPVIIFFKGCNQNTANLLPENVVGPALNFLLKAIMRHSTE